MSEINLACLLSGGKDSTYALYWAYLQSWNISCGITLVPEKNDSYMFHSPNINLTKIQSKALGIPLITQTTSGIKEKELDDLKSALKKAKKEYNINSVLVGALFSDYQQERVNRICHELGLKTFAPLWHKKQDFLLKDMIENDFKIIIVHIASYGLDKSFLGGIIDNKILERLKELNKKYQVHVAGEGGEFETFVIDCPLYKKSIVIKDSEIVMENENTGTFVVKKAILQ